jgi:pimeloyl-ACP methyl ester carboxylesterase
LLNVAHKVGETFRIVARDGVTLAGDVAGPEGAPIVILMHGGGQTRRSWQGASDALSSRGYKVINFDSRGHGESTWSAHGAYGHEDRYQDLIAIMAAFGDDVALVGASMGGVTIMHALARGLRPRAAVLVDITPEPEPSGIDRIRTFMAGNPSGFANLDEAADAVAAYYHERPKPADPSGLRHNLRAGADGRLYWHWDPRVIDVDMAQERARMAQLAAAIAAAPQTPLLVVRGLRSDVVTKASIEALTRVAPHVESHDVAGAGHMVAGDRNDAFNAAILDFLDRHSQR